ncbi:TetR family transcriptional regulator [Corallococcus macrosporus]|uniref:TetR family transcriptional regulator n=1 Tax=Myxococcus fulvus (strain ATCC BAA-855 / HW-1) TaxID=483219 RepID=F8CFI2_MYXFH|nr:TetR family transcriptional regulator [Corallococcus macrosporus]
MYTLAQLRESRLCDAAELLAQRGLDNVRAAELARATRLSVGSLYRYYGSKQGIARAIRTLTERDLSYACFVAYQMADGDPLRQGFRDVFLAFWRELATWALLQPHLVGFTFLHPHPDADTPGEHDGRTRAQVLEVLGHGEREGAFPKGRTWIHECMVWGVLAELVRRAGQGEGMREEDVQITGEALWRALAPEVSASPRGGGSPPPEGEHPQPASTAVPASRMGMVFASAESAEPPAASMTSREERAPEALRGAGDETPPVTTCAHDESRSGSGFVPGTAAAEADSPCSHEACLQRAAPARAPWRAVPTPLLHARRSADILPGAWKRRGLRGHTSITDDDAVAAALVLGSHPYEQRRLAGLLSNDFQNVFAGGLDVRDLRVVNRDAHHPREFQRVLATLLHDHRLLGGGRGAGSRGRLRLLRQRRGSHQRQRDQGDANSVMHGVCPPAGVRSTFTGMTPAMPGRCRRARRIPDALRKSRACSAGTAG